MLQQRISKGTLLGAVWTLVGLMLYVFSDAFVKHITQQYSVCQVTFLRAFVRLIPLLIVSLARHGLVDLKTRHPKRHLARLCMNFISTYTVIYAMSREALVPVYVIYYTMPLVIVFLGKFFLKERVSGRQWAAVFAGFCGVIVAIRPGAMTISSTSLVVMIIGVVSAAINKTLIRQLTKTESSLTITLYPNISMIALLAPFVVFSWQPLTWPHWAAFLIMGCVVALAQYAVTHALRFAPVSALAPLDYSTFIWGLCCDMTLWGTVPQTCVIVGTIIIVWSNMFIFLSKRTKA